MDLNTKGSETESPPSKCNDQRKSCVDCHTTRTPCWRSGPAGPGSLCNACGIRYRKERRAALGLDKTGTEKSRRKIGRTSSNTNKLGVPLKMGFLGYEKGLVLQEKWKTNLGEEEQAAILLMALSCGSVYA